MDSLTHIFLGGSLAMLLAGRRAGFGRTFCIGALAATLPDLDVFLHAGNVVRDHALHRHFMHALVLVPLLAAVAILPWILRRQHRPVAATLCLAALIACLSHTLLDALTSYGTAILWPFSDRRFAWDIVAVVDPLYTLPLIAGVAWGWRKRSLPAVAAGLLAGLLYLGWAGIQHERAVSAQQQLIASRGAAADRPRVMPQIGGVVTYRSVYVANGRVYVDALRPGFTGVWVKEGGSLPLLNENELKPQRPLPAVEEDFAWYAWFTDGYVTRQPGDERLLADVRYGTSPESLKAVWGAELEGAHPQWRMATGRNFVAMVWRELWRPSGFTPLR